MPLETVWNCTLSKEQFLALGSLFSNHSGTALLFSGGDRDTSEHSFLFLFPIETLRITSDNPWEELRKTLPSMNSASSYPEWVGFISYEMGAFSDPDKRLSLSPFQPLAYFQRCALVIVLDHKSGKVTLFFDQEGYEYLSKEEKRWIEKLFRVKPGIEIPLLHNPAIERSTEILKSLESYRSYTKKILQTQEWILEGEVYQLNLSQNIVLKKSCHPFDVFLKLAQANPASFFAYLNCDDFTILSSSPERLLKCQKGRLETRPIKGTIPRGKNPTEDEQLRQTLLKSVKDRAELLMITDLMRNDLGRVSVPGSIQVDQLFKCEAYSNVFHLLSVISSQALPEKDPVDILRACFPGGSITGCPKLRAMELIHQLEKRVRGIYTGSIGYFSANGDFDFNVAIRTFCFREDIFEVQLGGAIVADSDPEKEYQEILAKGQSIFQVLDYGISV